MNEQQLAVREIIEQKALIKNVSGLYLVLKRLLDIAAALPAVILLSPVPALIALWLKLRGRGKAILSREKYGLNGARFRAYEFSGMSWHPRLRKLPLLFNVLLGSMSLVGPEPVADEEIKAEPWYTLRMSAKPGITGLWQVSGKAGGMEKMIRTDLKYIRERNMKNDLKILLKTFFLLFRKRKKPNQECRPGTDRYEPI